ncbi:alpha/beta hydrolase [Sphingomonas crocodyli]|uniref:Alpha/beta hydrolase n=1 Tax=Sphingomonas crocodyli TaxID=1979270 RepID=A0A437M9Z5_9SPHN|nr:alpha/beta hydrolase [Sphingomonas crocodyli]RVT94457.1 alpha/beta hydrolase [Sphingomonas crocodyli]
MTTKLDADARAALDEYYTLVTVPVETLPHLEYRARVDAGGDLKPKQPITRVEDFAVPGPDGDIPVRLYAHGDAPAPTLVFYHGGGFVIGSIKSHDATARAIALATGWAVLSVDYRLAPEHRFPAAAEDCYAALVWAASDAAKAKGIDTANLAVGGDSAGGNLAAVASIMARDRGGPVLRHQLLIYPVVDVDFDTPSYLENADGYLLSRDAMKWYWDHYMGPDGDRSHPHATPINAEVHDLPPATVITAGFDPLRDEGEAYAKKLEAAGVDVEMTRYPGAFHGFVGMGDLQSGRDAMAQIARRLTGSVA